MRDDIKDKYTSVYDIKRKRVLQNCLLTPRDVLTTTYPRLYARNTRHYSEDGSKEDKEKYTNVGTWILLVPTTCVNYIWKRIREAIKEDHLWSATVSTYEPETKIHRIWIHTIDCTDLKDVVSVLDYLETTGIKTPNMVSIYISDKQMADNKISGGEKDKLMPMYSSDTITRSSETTMRDDIKDKYTSVYDIKRKRVLQNCLLTPRDVLTTTYPRLYARNTRHYSEDGSKEDKEKYTNVGTWILLVPTTCVNYIWKRIREAIKEDHLWSATVSTYEPETKIHRIWIHTIDCTDLKDVVSVLDYLETTGIKTPNMVSIYISDKQMADNKISGGEKDKLMPMYSSDTITRPGQPTPIDFMDLVFEYDLETKRVLKECTLTPREVLKKNAVYLYAWNTRHPVEEDSDEDDDEDYEDIKFGYWMLFIPSACVNYVWKRVKEAIKEDHLWKARVSTYDPWIKKHFILIHTIDYTDLKDVISVLDYLERSGIKPPNTVIKYKTGKQTAAGIYSGGKQRASIYSSETIRNEILK